MTTRPPARRGSSLLEIQVAMVVLGIALAGACPMIVMQMKLLRRFEAPRAASATAAAPLVRGQRIVDGEPVVPAGEDPTPPVAVLHPHPDRWVRRLGYSASVDEQVGGPPLVPILSEQTWQETDAALVGAWTSVSAPDAAGGTALQLGSGDTAGSATWTFGAIAAGSYRVLVAWPTSASVPPDTVVTIADAGGSNLIPIAVATAVPGRSGSWVDLGNVALGPGSTLRLDRSRKGTVVADAVRVGARNAVQITQAPATTLGPDQGLSARVTLGPKP